LTLRSVLRHSARRPRADLCIARGHRDGNDAGMTILTHATACALFLCCAGLPQAPAPPDSIGRLIDLWHLPELAPSVRCRQFASTDPSGQGHDHGHFLRRDGKRAVLAAMDGPGVIVRLWSANAKGRLLVYCDGEATPRLDGPFADLFNGKLPPFVPPIATHASGGFISYFPIPYAKSCRVEVDQLDDPGALYYQVQYLTYPAGTPMRTFTRELPASERDALGRVLEVWSKPGRSPIAETAADLGSDAAVEIPPGEQRFVALDGPGTIVTLRIAPANATPAALRGLVLEIAWDGGEPSVRAPVGDFFAVGFGVTPYRGLALGWDDGGGYCHLPMPFRKRAQVALRNATGGAQRVTTRIRWRRGEPAATAGVFHAEFRSEDQVGRELYEFADLRGPGKFVGITQTLQGLGNLWYLEGNEQFQVDGEAQPSIVGTGTEDFYNAGWYWNAGPIALPLHGIGIKEEWTSNRTTPWRCFVPDAVPFAERLVARIEHGSRNEVHDASYASVAFWYAQAAQAVRAIPPTALRQPRQWQLRPQGFVGAGDLDWSSGAPVAWSTWDELTDSYRGLDKPLDASFPESRVLRDQPTLDARLALLPGGEGERTYRARFTALFADRFRLQLRLLGLAAGQRLLLDGEPLALPEPPPVPVQPDGPQFLDLPVTLAAGSHELAFPVAAASTARLGFDALRLVPASPFVRTFWIAPPSDAPGFGTVETAVPEEARFLAADFAPAAAGWKEVTVDSGHFDLNQHVSPRAPMFAFLLVHVHSKIARPARALLGSDDGVRVWLNGTLVWSHAVHRPLAPDQDQFNLPLQAGWNRLLLKVKNDDGGYGLMLRIADPDGGVSFASTPR
jgi:hypothetical protein